METNFAKLLKELYSLRQEMKEEIVTLKSNAKTRGGGGLPYETDGDARRLA